MPTFEDDELRRRIAANLKRLLEERGMDERDLARELGWSRPTEAHGAGTVRKYLRGEKWPREETILRWCEILDVDPEEFVRGA